METHSLKSAHGFHRIRSNVTRIHSIQLTKKRECVILRNTSTDETLMFSVGTAADAVDVLRSERQTETARAIVDRQRDASNLSLSFFVCAPLHIGF